MRALGWLNSYPALVFPYVVLNLPVCTLVLVSFFQSIPRDLENAAMIDGCTRFGAVAWCYRYQHPAYLRRAFSPSSTHGTVPAGAITQFDYDAYIASWHHPYQGEFTFRGQSFQQR